MKRVLAIALLVVVVLPLGAESTSCSRGGYQGEEETINVGSNRSGSAGLIYIAQELGIFASEALTVNDRDYDTGGEAMDALLNGEVDIAWSSEFALARSALGNTEISAIGVINRFTDQYLIGMKEHGVESLADLKGMKIGVPRNTIAEFYLTRFLALNGMSTGDVSLVDMLPEQATDAVSSGIVSAVVVWEPYSSRMKAQLADRIVAWSVQNIQPGFGVISSRNDWIDENPETLVRFLEALVKAEDYLIRNTEAARQVIQARLNYDDAFADALWSECRFSVALDQSLITAMEDEARWMMEKNFSLTNQVPNFNDYIWEDGLKAVKPEAVKIIR